MKANEGLIISDFHVGRRAQKLNQNVASNYKIKQLVIIMGGKCNVNLSIPHLCNYACFTFILFSKDSSSAC